MFLKDLGARIRARRERLGLKQQDIAAALNVSPQAVSKWERGENAPDVITLAPLAQLLGGSTDWLLGAHEPGQDEFEATVLVSSVSGAYERSLRMAARDFATWANGLFFQLTEVTRREDGVPVKYLGDQYLCFFAGNAHAARALATARSAQSVAPAELKMGLATGPIYLGAVGHPDYARPDIMGEVVNIAFLVLGWAEKHAGHGVAATECTVAAAEANAAVQRWEEASFHGIGRMIRIGALDFSA